MTIIPDGFADCSLQLTLTGFTRPAYVTWGVDSAETDPAALALAMYTVCTQAGSLIAVFPTSVRLAQVTVRLGTSTGEALVAVHPGTSNGPRSVGTPSPNVAALIYKRSARGGRRGRGRVYLPWALSEGNINEDGTIATVEQTLVQNAVSAWRTNINTTGNTMVLLHSLGKSSPGAPDAVTSLTISNVVGTQRRRLGR